jgi:chromosome segregation ATPase
MSHDPTRLLEPEDSHGNEPLRPHADDLDETLQDVYRQRDEAFTQVERVRDELDAVTTKLHAAEAAREAAQARQSELSVAVADLQRELSAARRELVAACIGESQRARLKAENEALTEAVEAARAAIGSGAVDDDPVAVVNALRSQLEAVNRSKRRRVAMVLRRRFVQPLVAATRRRGLTEPRSSAVRR